MLCQDIKKFIERNSLRILQTKLQLWTEAGVKLKVHERDRWVKESIGRPVETEGDSDWKDIFVLAK